MLPILLFINDIASIQRISLLKYPSLPLKTSTAHTSSISEKNLPFSLAKSFTSQLM